jgi:hypothetical protein
LEVAVRWMLIHLRWLVFASFLHIVVGCGGSSRSGSRGLGSGGASATSLFDTLNAAQIDKVDLLFVIDNSSSMADKQQILEEAVPHLVRRLVSPNCTDENGTPGTTPADPSADCPPPFSREFKPLTNIHIAVVTSSLGGHGAPGPNGQPHSCESTDERNDHAELVGSRPRGMGTGYPTPGDPFLNWNPAQGAADEANFVSQFQNMVRAAGQSGCPQPALLESMYRFLVDPTPPLNIVLAGNPPRATSQGIDQNILAQRKAFLRPDSLVSIVMVSDKNDCSIRDSDQYYFASVYEGLLPAPASVCGVNPNDPCCYSCGLPPPASCPPDPKCGPPPPSLIPVDDPPSLRCFEEKRRFGIDFLYPIKRYVNALTAPEICTTSPDLEPSPNCPARPDKSPGQIPNPLFQDLSGAGTTPRDPSLVYLAAIAGVPWQLLADPSRSPFLNFYTADQLEASNLWGAVLGDPHAPGGAPPAPPSDPHMQESIDPRPGLPGPNTQPDADPIHGHEWNITRRDDLQYACIFPRPSPGACTDSTCDCLDRSPGDNNPLCADAAGNYGTTQNKAKAYPGLRELELVHEFGKHGIVASICPKQLTAPDEQDYGYRPAVDAIVDRIEESFTTKCLPRRLTVAADGTVPCTIIEATTNPADSICDPARNRAKIDPRFLEPARAHLAGIGACDDDPNTSVPDCSRFLFCEIKQADQSCLSSAPSSGAIGWCYVDPDANVGDPALVARCPASERRLIRFVGENTPHRGSLLLMECHQRPASSPPGGL